MNGKLSDGRLKAIHHHFTTLTFPSSDPGGLGKELLAHIDALTAELGAATAENERLRALIARMSPDARRAFEDGAPLPEQGWYEATHPGQRRHMMELTSVTEEATKAENERLTRELGEATKKLDALAVDPAKREQLVAKCYEKLTGHYRSVVNCKLSDWSNQFQAGLVAAAEHAFAAGRLSRDAEVVALEKQLADLRGGDGEIGKVLQDAIREAYRFGEKGEVELSMLPWESLPARCRERRTEIANRITGPFRQRIAKLEREIAHETASSGEVISRLKADRDRLAAELATANQALADARAIPLGASVVFSDAAPAKPEASEPAEDFEQRLCPDCNQPLMCLSSDGSAGVSYCEECNRTIGNSLPLTKEAIDTMDAIIRHAEESHKEADRKDTEPADHSSEAGEKVEAGVVS